ncbi:hypothetical protein GCM10008956_12910 [Deinococcus arenae]|uniref:Capsule synthesis protein CapA domain-containing protein n=1 Tax=Deinococcus arenae TaxID=1452751 RepID=A0A8H9GMS1_9DEIO|nr:CapA family protein [Deinococcus arenae]AWT37686.1 hypothetical protein DM785_18520 [Deinococcus actinosclerus]GGM37946.1 hypothetical protein GCM10008956_12910 [Deinococcus arenae]
MTASTRTGGTLVFLGDLHCGDQTGAELTVRGAPPPGYVVANLEAPLTRTGERAERKICLRADPARVTLLTRLGVRAVSLANNHILDYGEAGARDTLRALDAAGIAHFGCGTPGNAYGNPLIVPLGSHAVGLLSYAHPSCHPLAQAGALGIALYDPARVRADVARARAQGARTVVACVHWGHEDCPVPGAAQVEVAREVRALGADYVIGHHGHIVQPRSDRTFFGLGNLHMPELNEPVLVGGQVDHVFRKVHMGWNTRSVVPSLTLPGGALSVHHSRVQGATLTFRAGHLLNLPPWALGPLARTEPLVRRLYYLRRVAALFRQRPRLPSRAHWALLLGRGRP